MAVLPRLVPGADPARHTRRRPRGCVLHCSSGGDAGCRLSHDDRAVRVLRHGTRFVCRVPMSALHVNERIRWKVFTTYRDGGHPDYAPEDRGWFV